MLSEAISIPQLKDQFKTSVKTALTSVVSTAIVINSFYTMQMADIVIIVPVICQSPSMGAL